MFHPTHLVLDALCHGREYFTVIRSNSIQFEVSWRFGLVALSLCSCRSVCNYLFVMLYRRYWNTRRVVPPGNGRAAGLRRGSTPPTRRAKRTAPGRKRREMSKKIHSRTNYLIGQLQFRRDRHPQKKNCGSTRAAAIDGLTRPDGQPPIPAVSVTDVLGSRCYSGAVTFANLPRAATLVASSGLGLPAARL